MIELRPMTAKDLVCLSRWLREPHVARWWPHTTPERELEKLSARVAGTRDPAIRMLTILEHADAEPADPSRRIGWCQWYPYAAYPVQADALGALEGDCGIDYAIGEPSATGRGLGTELITELVNEVHRHYPTCGITVDPDATNMASRRVLERNGFSLIAICPVASEPDNHPMAIYRLDGDRTRG